MGRTKPTRPYPIPMERMPLHEPPTDGAEVLSLEVPAEPHPLARFAGLFKDDPLFERWQRSIAKYRREVEADPDYR